MNRKYEFRHVTTIPFERSVYYSVIALLPKETTITDQINEFLKQLLVKLENERKPTELGKSAIRNCEILTTCSTSLEKQNQNSNFNIYSSTPEMIAYAAKIVDTEEAWLLTRKSKLFASLTETRAKRLRKESGV